MNNKVSAIIINGERREAQGSNLYNITVDGWNLESVLCRANGIEQKDNLTFKIVFLNGEELPFTAFFEPLEEGWVELEDIVPCTEAGHLYL